MKRQRAPEPQAQPLSAHRRDAEIEAWICEKLRLRDLFAGVTDTATRRDRLKVVLLERGILESIAPGKFDGRPITWRALFTKLYGEQIA